MKKATRVFVSILSIMIFFLLFFGGIYCLQPVSTREPAEGYQSLKEEYISAVETFNSTGTLIIPEGARFSYDNEEIIIRDKSSNVSLTCTFALNGTVPIYTWNDGSWGHTTYVFLLIFSTVMAFLFYYNVDQKAEKRKFKKLNKIKASSPEGDKRAKSTDCITCTYRQDCSCPTCHYVKDCGECFHPSCQTEMERHLESEDTNLSFEPEEDEE